MVIIVSPSLVTVVLHLRPSAVVSSNSTPCKKFWHENSNTFPEKKIFYQFKFQNDAFQGCGGHHFPFSVGFGDLHGWSGCSSSLSGEEPNTQFAEKVLVFLLFGSSVFSSDLNHVASIRM